MNGFQLKSIHGIDLSRVQGSGSGRDIRNSDRLDLIKVGAAFLPIIRIAFRQGIVARFMADQCVAAGADSFLPIGTARSSRNNGQMVIAHDKWEVGVVFLQSKHDGMLAIGRNVLDGINNTLGRLL